MDHALGQGSAGRFCSEWPWLGLFLSCVQLVGELNVQDDFSRSRPLSLWLLISSRILLGLPYSEREEAEAAGLLTALTAQFQNVAPPAFCGSENVAGPVLTQGEGRRPPFFQGGSACASGKEVISTTWITCTWTLAGLLQDLQTLRERLSGGDTEL